MKKKKLRHLLMIFILLISFLDSLMIKNISNGTPLFFERHISLASDPAILSELVYFPLAADCSNAEICSYEDSWQNARTFGGDRKHEGTDLMTLKDTRGIYPVVSMTDGTLEQLGWLKLGGWRIGIRSASGMYYYYAHLESYAEDLAEGMAVRAGQFLGFVGDSGYGVQGTTGQFAVHLHVGIYVPGNHGDEAVNPYPYLKKLEYSKIRAQYLN